MRPIVVLGLVTAVSVLTALPLGREGAADPALNKLLKGEYEFTIARPCVQNTLGVNSNFELLDPGTTRAASIRGRITYNGDGTGSSSDRTLNIFNFNLSTGGRPISQTDSTCNITYTVNPDNSYTEQLSCTGTVITGPSAGQTATFTGIVRQGQIADGGKILLISDTATNVETLILSISGTFRRVCASSGLAVKVK